MQSRPRRVLVVNHWHDDNRGDSAITQGILRLLFASDQLADVTLAGLTEPGPLSDRSTVLVERAFPQVDVVPSLLPTELRGGTGRRPRSRAVLDAGLWIGRLVPTGIAVATGRPERRLRRAIEEADLVVVVGGSNIYDDPSVSRVMSLARLLAVAAPVHAAVRARKPVVLLGHTLGPFANTLGMLLGRRLLEGADLAVVREQSSVEVAQELGVKRVETAPDMAFAIEPQLSPAVRAVLDGLPCPPSRCLAISVRQHPSLGSAADLRVVKELGAAARRLVADGVVDGVLTVAHTIGPTPIEDDRGITAQLMAELSGVPAVSMERELSPAELASLYGGVAGVIAVRLHAAILAVVGGTPVYAISYFTRKTEGVMAGLGLSNAVADFATVTADQIVEALPPLMSGVTRSRLAAVSASRRADLDERSRDWFEGQAPKNVRAEARV